MYLLILNWIMGMGGLEPPTNGLWVLVIYKLKELRIPSITNSIARAPSNNPKIFSTTVTTVGPNLDESFAESHIARAAIKTTINIGK